MSNEMPRLGLSLPIDSPWLNSKHFGADKMSWVDCTAQQFRGFLLDCMKNGMARSYVRLTFAALRSFYKYLVEREGFRDNPLREVQLPKMEKKLPIVLSVSQVDELLTAPNKFERQVSSSCLGRCTRRSDDGAFLQQRSSSERTSRFECRRCRYVQRDRARARKRSQRTNRSGGTDWR